MIPGTTNLPATSMTVAPAGAATPGPMSRRRPFSITIVTLLCGAAPLPSIRVAPRRTVTCAAALPTNRTVAARVNKDAARKRNPFISEALRPMHHGWHEVFDCRRADLLHGAAQLR